MATASTDSDEDTITVETSAPRDSLPTPSDTATETSSESSQIMEVKDVPQGKPKRVNRQSTRSRKSIDGVLTESESAQKLESRSVSGETLVTSTSTSSLLQTGITALNLPWSMSSIFGNGGKGDVVAAGQKSLSMESLETMRPETEEEEPEETDADRLHREEKAAAKRAKAEENAKLREARWKAADEKATKRSSRVSVLGKASDIMSEIATSVLGKRPRSAFEKGKDVLEGAKKSLTPQSTIEPPTAPTAAFEGPMSKKRRLSDGDVQTVDQTASIPTKKQILQRKHKRWLASGLYAGQARTFNPCLTESKNKKLSSKPEEPQKENSVIPLPMFAGERLLKQGRNFKLPFDIFSPLPAGQPKPDEWKKTNKNVFIGDAAEFWRVHKFQEYSTCLCRKDVGCDEDCINKMMYYECDDNNCLLTADQCGNRAFAGLKERVKHGNKYDVGVEVLKTVDRGNGVRSNRCFAPNQIIVEYTGEILTQEECENRMHTRYKDNECYYLMAFDQNMIIDATRGSIARFVNHSCAPNCRMEKWTVAGKPRMALFAGENGIVTGEELTYDYNFDPYSQKNVQECRCGAKNCRGYLGPRSKDPKKQGSEEKEEEKRPQSRLAGARKKIAEVLDESTSRLNKRKAVSIIEAKVYSSARKASPIRISKKGALQKKPMRVSSMTRAVLSRKPSKLRKIIAAAKDNSNNKRVASGASGEALLNGPKAKGLIRSTSVREKAHNLKTRAVRSMRGK